MSFMCRICCQTFEEIPPDAIKIGENRRGHQLYRFRGHQSVVHDLRVARPEKFLYRTHLRWHVNRSITKPDCGFCNSPKPDNLSAVNPPEPATELLEAAIQTLSELPTPEAGEPETAMSIAFRNFKNN